MPGLPENMLKTKVDDKCRAATGEKSAEADNQEEGIKMLKTQVDPAICMKTKVMRKRKSIDPEMSMKTS